MLMELGLEKAGRVQRRKEALEEGSTLWEYTPQTLLDTIIFYNGLFFALCSLLEHRQLRRDLCQIQVVEHPGEHPFLRYLK